MPGSVNKNRLLKLVKKFSGANILVIGDLIYDEYIWGSVERISPEAPVPIVRADKSSYVPGGAANVSNNIRALGGGCGLSGVIGRDIKGRELIKRLRAQGVKTSGIHADAKRHTTVKTRIIAGHQQVVRLDWEHTHSVGRSYIGKLRTFLKNNISGYQGIIIEDYGKGLITPQLLSEVNRFRRPGQIVVVDPKENHFEFYKDVTAITPNKKELENAVRYLKIKGHPHDLAVYDDKLSTDKDISAAAKELKRYLNLNALLVTLGENGMKLLVGDEESDIPVFAQEVYDVSGAGDTVISVFTLALVSGASFKEAAVMANCAAANVVSKIGTATLSVKELSEEIKKSI